MKNPFDLNLTLNHIGSIKNAVDAPCFDLGNKEEIKIHLRPSESVSRGMFKPDPLLPGGHIAHPVTIRAMRKDLFLLGDNFIDLEVPYICESCKKVLDLQFWQLCPYCETSIEINKLRK